jgi:DNA-binding CsgD family transcriptional regulator
VVSLLGDGRTPGRIAETLGISVHTVRRHLANAADKVQVRGIVALRAYAVTHGFVRHLAHPSPRADEAPLAH